MKTACQAMAVPPYNKMRYSTHSEPDFLSLLAVQTINFPFNGLPLLVMDWVIFEASFVTADASVERSDRKA